MRSLVVGGLALGLSAAAAAQTPLQRDSIELFRAEIEAIDDSTILLDMESSLIDVARIDRDNALLHLKLGFLAYRIGEVTEDRQHFDDAGGEFEWAGELEPEWPYAWYGLGLAELSMGESSVIPFENIRQALGMDYLSKAASAFARAASVDPAFSVAVVDLAETAMQQKVFSRVEVALAAVREAAATEASDVPGVQLVRGRLERTVGDPDSAVAAFGRYLDVGGDSGVGYFELARTLYHVGRTRGGQRAYFQGAALSASPAATALYREDVSWVATAEELAAFDSVSVAERAAWLEEFWWRRDAADLRSPGDRLAEHYRRYFYARAHYPLMSRHRRYDVTNPYRNDQQVFDDRGIIYVRHGEPDRRAFASAVGSLPPNETWLYQRPDQNLVFHFVAADDIQDYKLVESLADVLGAGVATRLQTGADSTLDPSGLFASRSVIDPAYQRLANFPTSRARLLADERRAGERSIAVGTTTDAYPLRFDSALDGVLREYIVGDPDDRGWRLLLVYAVPAGDLAPEASGEGITYRLGVRAVLMMMDGEAVVYVDSANVLRTDRVLEQEQQLSGLVSVPVRAGDYRVRVVLSQRRRAGQVVEDTVRVPDLETEPMTLSDLIVGQEGTGLQWVTGGDTVYMAPTAKFPQSARLQVYYEVHGLERGTPYRSRLEVRKEGGGSVFGFFKRLFGGGGPPIALSFDGVASGPTTRILQTVDISELDPGRYRLRVTVEDSEESGRIEREFELEVEGT